MYADDLALLADTPGDLQTLLTVCEQWADKNFLEFAPEKSKVLIVHQMKLPKQKRTPILTLNDKQLQIVNEFNYLGITVSRDGDVSNNTPTPYNAFIKNAIQKAKKRAGVVALLGTHKDGLRPVTAARLYKSLVRPILEFGAQVVCYAPKQLKELERVQTAILRRLLCLSGNTKPSVVRFLAGVEPVEARVHQLKLAFFHHLRTCDRKRMLARVFRARFTDFGKILNRYNSCVPAEATTTGAIPSVHTILAKYNMLHEFHTDTDQPRDKYKNYIRAQILEKHRSIDMTQVENSSRGKYMYRACCDSIAGVKPYVGTFLGKHLLKGVERANRSTLLRFISVECFISEERSPLFKRHRTQNCPFCCAPDRDIAHYVLDCPKFRENRKTLLENLKSLDPGVVDLLDSLDRVGKIALILSAKQITPPQTCNALQITATYLRSMEPYFSCDKRK